MPGLLDPIIGTLSRVAPGDVRSIIQDQEPCARKTLGVVAERAWRNDLAAAALKPS